jgi:hypothetical protein
MTKQGLKVILTLLLILIIIVLINFIGESWRWRPIKWISFILEDLNRRSQNSDIVITLYRDIIKGLVFISCTCLICLTYLVSKK